MNEEGDIRFYAQVQAIVCEMQSIIATVKGMEWENHNRLMRGESLAYVEDAFNEQSDMLIGLRNTLRSM